MSKQTTLEERLRIGALAEVGLSDREIAVRVGWSCHTVGKWRRRQAQAGRVGLVTRMGRPAGGALARKPSGMGATDVVRGTASARR